MQESDTLLKEQFSEIANILQCIVDYPKEAPPEIRSNYFKVIQAHTQRALIKLEQHPLIV